MTDNLQCPLTTEVPSPHIPSMHMEMIPYDIMFTFPSASNSIRAHTLLRALTVGCMVCLTQCAFGFGQRLLPMLAAAPLPPS